MAYHASSEPRGAYYNWHSEQPINNRGHVEILSDGILRQKDFALFFDTETVDSTIPVVSTETVNIHSDVVFDTGFLSTVMRNGITVNVFDDNAVYMGSFIPHAPLKAPKVTHEQLRTYYEPNRRLNLAREFVLASIHNSMLNIRYHDKQESDPRYEEAINAMNQVKVKIKQEKTYESLLLLEAQARRIYYGCYDTFIKREEFAFEFRSQKPPLNPFNAMLSYGNTVLYGLIATEIQKTPLDVRIGFLHATTTRLNSLNLDIAEVFKPLLVDRVVLSLVNKGIISSEHFETCENGGIYLTAEGKRVFLRAFYDKLDTVITVKDRKMSYDGIIKEEIRKLVRHFRDEDKYRGFRQVR
jgi:CRISPR-associated endonuclease Cas1 subtype I-B